MANEKRLIPLQKRIIYAGDLWQKTFVCDEVAEVRKFIETAPTVDAVEVPDKQLLRAVKLLIIQYEHSKQSDFVHNPIAHAFFHTWKELDKSGYGERRTASENL